MADMGVSLRAVAWLCAAGHDVRHPREQGLQRLPNGDIFAKAAREGRILLTFDLDFGEILASSGGQVVSVILFGLRNTRTPRVIERLGTVLERCGPALAEGAIVVVEDARHRLRRLPLHP